MAKVVTVALFGALLFLSLTWSQDTWKLERSLRLFEKVDAIFSVRGSLRKLHAVETDSQNEIEGSHEKEAHETHEGESHEGEEAEHNEEASEEETGGEKTVEEEIEKLKEDNAEILQFTISVLVAFFIFADVLLLYLVNYRDANVRNYIYQMLSSTLSIFLAVTLNMSGFSFVLEQILPSPWPRGFGMKVTRNHEFVVGVLIFITVMATVNYLCFLFHDKNNPVVMKLSLLLELDHQEITKAIRIIGGHIAGFAGLITFGSVQIYADEGDSWFSFTGSSFVHFTVFLVAGVVLGVVIQATRIARNRFCGYFNWAHPEKDQDGKIRSSLPNFKDLDDEEQKRWRHKLKEAQEWRREVCEAEDDACAFIMAFLACQLSIKYICGEFVPLPPHVDHEHHGIDQVKALAAVIIFFVVFVVASMVAKRTMRSSIREHDPTSFLVRALSGLQAFGTMAIAWVVLRLGEWIVVLLLTGTILYSHDMVHIVNAALLSVVSIICVICLDFFADRAAVEDNLSNDTNDMARSNTSRPNADDVRQQFMKTFENFRYASRDVTIFERALRSVIQSFGLLVGLCWERATDAAIDTIIEGNGLLNRHHVWSKILAAALVLVVMGRAWLKYILPFAEMSAEEHEMAMALETHTGGEKLGNSTREAFVMKAVKGLKKEELDAFLQTMQKLLDEAPEPTTEGPAE